MRGSCRRVGAPFPHPLSVLGEENLGRGGPERAPLDTAADPVPGAALGAELAALGPATVEPGAPQKRGGPRNGAVRTGGVSVMGDPKPGADPKYRNSPQAPMSPNTSQLCCPPSRLPPMSRHPQGPNPSISQHSPISRHPSCPKAPHPSPFNIPTSPSTVKSPNTPTPAVTPAIAPSPAIATLTSHHRRGRRRSRAPIPGGARGCGSAGRAPRRWCRGRRCPRWTPAGGPGGSGLCPGPGQPPPEPTLTSK